MSTNTNKVRTIEDSTYSLWYTSDSDESADTPITSTAVLRTVTITTNAGTDRFIRFYDKATAATQSDTPFLEISLNPDTNIAFPLNYRVTNGLSVRSTTGAAVDNTGAPNQYDVFVSVTYTT